MITTLTIIGLGLIGFITLDVIQRKKNKKSLDTLQQDINKYHIYGKFHHLEVETLNGLIKSNDEERKVVINELHENIGNKIAAAKMQFGAIQNQELIESNYYQRGHVLLDEAVNDTRQLAYNMSDREISEFNIINSLNNIKQTIDKEGQIHFGLFHHGVDKKLGNELSLTLFRMVQELITNVLVHSKANHVTLQLSKYAGELILTVEDDGIGFDPQALNFIERKGLGLKGIKQSINRLRGQLFIDSTPGHGTTVTIEIPVAA
ncbi:sensor histidine kinase [Reichenbachiella ulvae]|uniref:histidine kinase n=1 Tax=Reichenbachiella ulvae TaxID=2980104 RepID=A0ABT3D0Z4_9BACT|nr:ATP-binding protein [Reichenbachiella ulvae]MCV9389415.1 ATP-binding protein [Reichenbachiella ulvae]